MILESYAQRFKDCQQTVPNVVNILLEDAYKKISRRDKKRIANCKSANISRARKKQLIDELTAANAKLRRHALVLSYLPDPIVVIGTDGKINFCSVQLGRVLKHDVEELEGASIDDIILPASRDKIHGLIQDLVAVAELAGKAGGQREGLNSLSESRDIDASVKSSNSPNAFSRASHRSFPMLEVNFNADVSSDPSSEGGINAKHKSSSATMSSLTQKSSTSTSEFSTTEDSDAPSAKRAKTVGASATSKILGVPVARGGSKPLKKTEDSTSSLSNKADQHQPSLRQHVERVRSPFQPAEKQAGSVDSGYRNSNESSDAYASSMSSNCKLLQKKGQ